MYKFCRIGKSGVFLAISRATDFSLAGTPAPVLSTRGDVYVENMEPTKFDGSHRSNKSKIVYTSSFFHLTLRDDSDDTHTKSISSQICRRIAETKRYDKVLLKLLLKFLYTTGNDVSFSYPFLGKRCGITCNIFVEYGSVITTDGENLITNMEESTDAF